MEEEKNELQTEDIIEDFVPTDEIIQEIMDAHFAKYADEDEDEYEDEVTTEEVEGLAVSIVELNEMYNDVKAKQAKLIQNLDELQVRLNKLNATEEV